MNVVVDLPAVRPARLAEGCSAADVTAGADAFRALLRGAHVEPLPDGVRLSLSHDLRTIARLADLVRAEADGMPFLHFRLLAEAPACRLEVTGAGPAGELARVVFAALAR